MPLDSGDLLPVIEPDSPAGPNLEFDADFGAMERAAQGKPEQQVGDTLIPAEDPDWKDVEAQAAALTDRTQDLRVLALLAVARLHRAGVAGYAGVTTTIRRLLEQRWEAVHPQLDPEDDLDPTLRANALLRLAEPARVLRPLRDLKLAASTRAGSVSWRDIATALGIIEPEEGQAKLTEAVIRAAFTETEPARITVLREAVATAIGDLVAIPAAFDSNAGPATGPDFEDLLKLLRDMQRFIDRYAAVPDQATEATAQQEQAVDQQASDQQASDQFGDASQRPARAGPVTPANLGPITTRSDAILLLELVRGYYERYEPSSPLPFLIDRARRLADKDFMEILRDLAPDGLNQAQHIAGRTE